MAWYRRSRDSRDVLGRHSDQRFHRMWTYYLLSSAGAFRARSNQLWQLVLSPSGLNDGYRRSEREARFAAVPQGRDAGPRTGDCRQPPNYARAGASRTRTSSTTTVCAMRLAK